MMLRYVPHRKEIELRVVNTSPFWRPFDRPAAWKHVVDNGIRLPRDIIKFICLLFCRRPKVVHMTTSGRTGIFRDLCIMTLANLARVPITYHIRFGRIPQIAEQKTKEWRLLARAMRMAHTVVPIDQTTEEAIAKHLPNVRLKRIPNCIAPQELPRAVAGDNNERTLVYLGWVIPTKGIDELVGAWARLKPKGWRLRIIGPGGGGYLQELEDRHHPERVQFDGELNHDEAMSILAKADAFVLPSYTEGFPNVVLEAMTLGKPIVATTVGAIPEMLADNCGILIPPRNLDALIDALSRLLNDSDLRSSLGARAKERAFKKYSIDIVFEQLMDTWRDAAGTETSSSTK